MSDIEIRPVMLEQIIDLRHRVLRSGLPREAAYFPGDEDPDTVHLGAMQAGEVVGCATLLINSFEGTPACQLRGMAIDSAYQRHGVGRGLLAEIEKSARKTGLGLIWANARTPAAGFYQRCGWEIVSEEFEIPTAGPHFRMIRRL
ncbi:MAG: GNAT family N-acetyltransferase [Planctomycetota bacterium]|nr:GNAT family N-acetyltransferase [Planctomycetota bacterium]